MANEITSVKPEVNINGAEVSDLSCIRVVRRTGIAPSTCDLQYIPVGAQGVQGPLTLLNGPYYEHKSRVLIYNKATSSVWFQGWLTKRRDQHAQNMAIWTASDDSILMRNVYVKGAYVLDTLLDTSNELKYSPAINAVFNPKGAWNCTGIDIGGDVYPVFTPTAIFGKAYESPDQDYSGDPPTDGSHSPWTARRILKYLQLVMHSQTINGGSLDGEPTNGINSINEDYLYLDYDHITGLDATDPGISTLDPLDRATQELSLQGDTLLGAFAKTLKIAGTHQIATLYSTTGMPAGAPEGKTQLRFTPIGYTSQLNWKNVDLQFDSLVTTDQGQIYDFSISEDSTNTTRKAYCEGESEKLEIRLQYSDTSGTDTIVPAWTSGQQSSFYRVIYGNHTLTGNPGKYALVPKVSGKESYLAADYTEADGTGGTSIVRAMTKEAIALAMQSYPTVFRAFQLKTQGDLLTGLGSGGLSGPQGVVVHPRSILPTQLQFLTWQASAVGDSRLRMTLPVRLSIQRPGGGEYLDVPRDLAIRVTTDAQGNNLIWLDGAGPAMDGTIECIYSPSLIASLENIKNDYITVNNFYINVAMPKDNRVKGYKQIGPQDGMQGPQGYIGISTEYDDAFVGGLPMVYIDAPTSYRGHYQYKSYPASNLKYFGGVGGAQEISMPLTRYLPPDDESPNASFAATREIMRLRRPIRQSSWMQAGIVKGINAGDWLGYVYVYKGGVANDYLVNGVVNTVVWDFLNTTTKIGDVFGDYAVQL